MHENMLDVDDGTTMMFRQYGMEAVGSMIHGLTASYSLIKSTTLGAHDGPLRMEPHGRVMP